MIIEKIKVIDKKIISFASKINQLESNQSDEVLIDLYNKHKVEIIIAKGEKGIYGCCFLFPQQIDGIKVYWLFNLYSLKNNGSGLRIIKYAMNKYENLCCIGVTKEAEILYKGLNWQRENSYKRYFKIINLKLFIKKYKKRINNTYIIFIAIFFYITKLYNILIINNNTRLMYKYVKAGNILRVLNNEHKINFFFKLNKDELYNIAGIEFLSNFKQNLFLSLINGFFIIKSPLFFYTKNNKINKKLIKKNIFTFRNTDKIF